MEYAHGRRAWQVLPGVASRVFLAVCVSIFVLVGLVMFVWLFVPIIFGPEDVLRAYRFPEEHAHVRALAWTSAGPDTSAKSAGIAHDFDGDGTADVVTTEYLHREPIFGRATSGMVYVRSGTTGAALLAHAIACPLPEASFCGDRDGNGTDDLHVVDAGQSHLLGFVYEP
jgi:hypothetical protein